MDLVGNVMVHSRVPTAPPVPVVLHLKITIIIIIIIIIISITIIIVIIIIIIIIVIIIIIIIIVITIIAKRAMWRPLGVTVGLVPLILVRLKPKLCHTLPLTQVLH